MEFETAVTGKEVLVRKTRNDCKGACWEIDDGGVSAAWFSNVFAELWDAGAERGSGSEGDYCPSLASGVCGHCEAGTI